MASCVSKVEQIAVALVEHQMRYLACTEGLMLNENYASLYSLDQLVEPNVGRLNQCTYDTAHYKILARTILFSQANRNRQE